MKTTLRSIFLTSGNPAATARFYRDVAGLELEQIGSEGEYIYWKIDRDGIQLAIHDAGAFADYTHPVQPNSNLTHLYFHIQGQKEFLAHLASQGIEPYSTDDVVITVVDPDGRKVMFGTANS